MRWQIPLIAVLLVVGGLTPGALAAGPGDNTQTPRNESNPPTYAENPTPTPTSSSTPAETATEKSSDGSTWASTDSPAPTSTSECDGLFAFDDEGCDGWFSRVLDSLPDFDIGEKISSFKSSVSELF